MCKRYTGVFGGVTLAKNHGGATRVVEVRPYLPQLVAAFGIVVGGSIGTIAAVDTGELVRFACTAIFLAITVPIYIWKFVLPQTETYSTHR